MSTFETPEENSENSEPQIFGKPGNEDWHATIFFDAATPVEVQLEKIIPWLESSDGMYAVSTQRGDGSCYCIDFYEKPKGDPPEPERVYHFIQRHQSNGGSGRPTTPRGPS